MFSLSTGVTVLSNFANTIPFVPGELTTPFPQITESNGGSVDLVMTSDLNSLNVVNTCWVKDKPKSFPVGMASRTVAEEVGRVQRKLKNILKQSGQVGELSKAGKKIRKLRKNGDFWKESDAASASKILIDIHATLSEFGSDELHKVIRAGYPLDWWLRLTGATPIRKTIKKLKAQDPKKVDLAVLIEDVFDTVLKDHRDLSKELFAAAKLAGKASSAAYASQMYLNDMSEIRSDLIRLESSQTNPANANHFRLLSEAVTDVRTLGFSFEEIEKFLQVCSAISKDDAVFSEKDFGEFKLNLLTDAEASHYPGKKYRVTNSKTGETLIIREVPLKPDSAARTGADLTPYLRDDYPRVTVLPPLQTYIEVDGEDGKYWQVLRDCNPASWSIDGSQMHLQALITTAVRGIANLANTGFFFRGPIEASDFVVPTASNPRISNICDLCPTPEIYIEPHPGRLEEQKLEDLTPWERVMVNKYILNNLKSGLDDILEDVADSRERGRRVFQDFRRYLKTKSNDDKTVNEGAEEILSHSYLQSGPGRFVPPSSFYL